MRLRVLLAVGAFLVFSVSAESQGVIVWSWPCTTNAAVWPACGTSGVNGYTSDRNGVLYNLEMIEDAGPAGENVAHYDWLVGCTGACDAQGSGWLYTESQITTTDTPVSGDSRFFRFVYKIITPYNWDTDLNPGQKHVDWGALCQDIPYQPTRMITHWWPGAGHGGGGDPTLMSVENAEGVGDFAVASNTPVNDTWVYVQEEWQSSSTPSATDAELRIWINNTTYSNPTAELTGTRFRVSGWPGGADTDNCTGGSYIVGGSTTDAIAAGASFEYYVTGWEYGTAFDTTWGAAESGDGTNRKRLPRGFIRVAGLWLFLAQAA